MRKQRFCYGRLPRTPAMTIRQSSMTVRKGLLFKFICIFLFCSLIVYAIHLYRKAYNFSSKRSYLISKLAEQYQSQRMAASPPPVFGESAAGEAGAGNQMSLGAPQGAPIVSMQNKLVHFDLKGMPPTVEAFKSLFPFLTNIGVTGILMEYEDMFPFTGKLRSIANKAAYTTQEIQTILSLAKANKLQVIPLIQTFGHLEFILKLDEFERLREVPRYPQVICPSNNHSMELIKDMVDQIMKLHPDVMYLHIGSDEVYYIGLCAVCQDRMSRLRMDAGDLFLQHAKQVALYVKEKHKVQPLMWDDEFRNLDEKMILSHEIGDLVEIVVWNYSIDVPNRIRPHVWLKYAKIFKSVWVGSAFKGANKPNSIATNETLYLTNHYSWMDVIAEYHDKIKFKGIFLTGWQRYDHFAVLCEIFPVAIPSLVSCMFYLNANGQPRMEKIFSMASVYLNCGSDMQFCEFPGSQIYNEVSALASLQATMKRIKEQNIFLGWTQAINLRRQFSSPSHVDSVLQDVTKLTVDLERLETSLVTGLRLWFPDWSVLEWMETNYHPLAKEVATLKEGLEKLARKNTFPVRPVPLPSTSSDDAGGSLDKS